ncbi:hypothetical protein BJ508DRAFT_329578 [Ascobolus immersus RN42]|uniref:Uncharacterized protein n=1 Tax=Ascobolus immersus RN42 TaxID=1160509 RepID=A0A3N4HY91_ASCIM|nr:hypothetical protein BJ508DRAFT_329578 [Ascobolus immersus RN42]
MSSKTPAKLQPNARSNTDPVKGSKDSDRKDKAAAPVKRRTMEPDSSRGPSKPVSLKKVDLIEDFFQGHEEVEKLKDKRTRLFPKTWEDYNGFYMSSVCMEVKYRGFLSILDHYKVTVAKMDRKRRERKLDPDLRKDLVHKITELRTKLVWDFSTTRWVDLVKNSKSGYGDIWMLYKKYPKKPRRVKYRRDHPGLGRECDIDQLASYRFWLDKYKDYLKEWKSRNPESDFVPKWMEEMYQSSRKKSVMYTVGTRMNGWIECPTHLRDSFAEEIEDRAEIMEQRINTLKRRLFKEYDFGPDPYQEADLDSEDEALDVDLERAAGNLETSDDELSKESEIDEAAAAKIFRETYTRNRYDLQESAPRDTLNIGLIRGFIKDYSIPNKKDVEPRSIPETWEEFQKAQNCIRMEESYQYFQDFLQEFKPANVAGLENALAKSELTVGAGSKFEKLIFEVQFDALPAGEAMNVPCAQLADQVECEDNWEVMKPRAPEMTLNKLEENHQSGYGELWEELFVELPSPEKIEEYATTHAGRQGRVDVLLSLYFWIEALQAILDTKAYEKKLNEIWEGKEKGRKSKMKGQQEPKPKTKEEIEAEEAERLNMKSKWIDKALKSGYAFVDYLVEHAETGKRLTFSRTEEDTELEEEHDTPVEASSNDGQAKTPVSKDTKTVLNAKEPAMTGLQRTKTSSSISTTSSRSTNDSTRSRRSSVSSTTSIDSTSTRSSARSSNEREKKQGTK